MQKFENIPRLLHLSLVLSGSNPGSLLPLWVHHWVLLGSMAHINPLSSGSHVHFTESVSQNPGDFLSTVSCFSPDLTSSTIPSYLMCGTTSFLDISLPLVSRHPTVRLFYLHWLKPTLLYWFFFLSVPLTRGDLLPWISCLLALLHTYSFGNFNNPCSSSSPGSTETTPASVSLACSCY